MALVDDVETVVNADCWTGYEIGMQQPGAVVVDGDAWKAAKRIAEAQGGDGTLRSVATMLADGVKHVTDLLTVRDNLLGALRVLLAYLESKNPSDDECSCVIEPLRKLITTYDPEGETEK